MQCVDITLSRGRLTQLLAGSLDLKTQHQAPPTTPDDLLGLTVPVGLKRVGREMRMLVENADDQTPADPGLLRIIARAHHIQAPAPSASDFVEDAFVQSASTYPASGSCPRPRWRSARPGPHKTRGVERHFLNQGSSTPFDCQAISLPPLANIVSPSTHQSRCQADSYANMGASLAAKCCPCRRTAHEMRASLLASATTATFG